MDTRVARLSFACSLVGGALAGCEELDGLPVEVTAQESARHASACGEIPPIDEIPQEPIEDPEMGMTGVRLRVNIGDIEPREAAAVWWNQPAQSTELFPGSSFAFLSGTNSEYGFVYQVSAELPGVGVIDQVARYTADDLEHGRYRITVDAFVENLLWRKGRGTYSFCRGHGPTVLEILSLYDAKVPTDALNAGALAAAQAHQQRYLDGRRPTAAERAMFKAAVRNTRPCD